MNEIIRTELLPGTTLCGGKYVIEKKLGAGGFGITYIAKHATLEKRYAIKEFFLSGYNVRNNVTNHISLQGIETQDFEKFRLRFIEEARTLAALNNEAVVKVIDIFDENGTSYMVMPFVEGVTLQSMVEKNGPMDYEMAVNYIVQVCEALSYIHSKNILHRDVTPDNIIVTPSQKIVLIDFGSARKFVDNKTQRHTTIVKKGYAPLEQYSATSRKGAYTDLYSLGAVFYYILTGEKPMDATERVLEIMREPIDINPKIPEQINAIIMKAMEMDSTNRYQSATELMDDIFSGRTPERAQSKSRKEKQDTGLAYPVSVKTDLENGENTNNPKSIEHHTKKGNKWLVFLSITIATIAAVILLVVLVNRTGRHNFPSPSLNDVFPSKPAKESVQSASSPIIPLDSLVNEKSSILAQKALTEPNNPAVLYALANKAEQGYWTGQTPELARKFWDEVLAPQGDVDNYLSSNKDFNRKRFAFVCAARAHSNIKKSIENDSYTNELKEKLERLIIKLKSDSSGNMVYEVL